MLSPKGPKTQRCRPGPKTRCRRKYPKHSVVVPGPKHVLAENATKSQVFHIGHNYAFWNLEIATKIGNYLGLNDYISFEKDRLINDTIYPADSVDIFRDFGWKPTRDIDDFLPETIEWYKEHLDNFRDLV